MSLKKKKKQQQQQQQQRRVSTIPCPNIFWYWGRPHSSLNLAARSCLWEATEFAPGPRRHGTQCPHWSPWLMHHPSGVHHQALVLGAKLGVLGVEYLSFLLLDWGLGWLVAASQLIEPPFHEWEEAFQSPSRPWLSALSSSSDQPVRP